MDIMSRINSFATTQEAIAYLTGLQLTNTDLKVLAEQSKVSFLGNTTKEARIKWLVQSTLGSRLQSESIRRI